ncbi:CHAT domain-containing protein [Myxococcaceae bacterium JPH2]|nr:CHAT domain-containing protein [Myxococcaceae bacterium JPH2]
MSDSERDLDMLDIHDQVHLFADDELSPEEAASFREHLVTCERCMDELDVILELKSAGEAIRAEEEARPLRVVPPPRDTESPAPPPAQVPREAKPTRAFRPAWSGRRRWVAAVALSGSLTAALTLALFRSPTSDGSEQVVGPEALALAPTRSLEARLSWSGASGYRPYGVKRSGDERPRELVPLQALAKLEAAGDLHGLGTGHLLRGEVEQAREDLKRAPSSPDVDSDRAVVALQRGDLEDALVLLEGVLAKEPRHAAAMWNRSLVLRELGLDLLAAEGFEQVAALNEPGWSQEARERAEAVRRQTKSRQDHWNLAWTANKTLVADGTPLPATLVREAPALARKYLYLAAWTAPTAERVRALLPEARELDAHYGGDVLARYIERTQKRDFARRGPLATSFAQVLTGAFDMTGADAFVRALRASGDSDILLGALALLGRLPAELDDYARAADAVGDPWFQVNAELQRAQAKLTAGEMASAEAMLLKALPACELRKLDARCGELESVLTYLYTSQHRLVEAREHALRGLERARASNDPEQETQFLQHLGQIARFRDAFALTRAYLRESALRQPDVCAAQVFLHETLAMLESSELRFDAARTELGAVPDCGAPRSALSPLVLADLSRVAPRPGDLEAVRALAASARTQPGLGKRPGLLLMVDHAIARAELEHDRVAGRRQLEDLIAAAEKLPREDTGAQKARAASYSLLILEAGRAGDFAGALDWFARESGGAAPTRCLLGVEIAEERMLVAARGAKGEAVGTLTTRSAPAFDVPSLVSAPVLDALRPCEHVSVFARYPLHGRAGLLPSDFAWSYQRGDARPPVAASGAPRRLVVSDVNAPAGLGLPRLSAWLPGTEPAAPRVDLTGAAATPERVLAEMPGADEIDIHAHGLVNLGISDASLIVLSAQADGRYALTAGEVRRQHLSRAPVVILASCRAAETAPYLHEPWSLPVAFLEAGARAVIASPSDIPDAEAGAFFEAVRRRVREGASPSVAVKRERMEVLGRNPGSWVQTVVVFE